MPVKGAVRVDEELCKGCELCISSCPHGALELNRGKLNSKGFHPACPKEGLCVGCCNCAVVCPEAAIVVLRQGARVKRVVVNKSDE